MIRQNLYMTCNTCAHLANEAAVEAENSPEAAYCALKNPIRTIAACGKKARKLLQQRNGPSTTKCDAAQSNKLYEPGND